MATPYTDKKSGRNICILYSTEGISYFYKFFYAHKKIIKVEDEEIRGKKKLATGEIRVRWKKRRIVELELMFFDGNNQTEDTYNPGYAGFETVINAPFLIFEYNTSIDSECPYAAPDVFANGNTAVMNVEKKEIEYINGLIDRKLVKLTLSEAKSWYA